MYENTTVDTASGKPIMSYAQWQWADVQDAMGILAQLSLAPLWPSVFPNGYDPGQAPEVMILARRPKGDFSDHRIGDILSVEKSNGQRRERWRVAKTAFRQPTEIRLYFANEERTSSFCLRYNLWTPEEIADHGFSRSLEAQDGGLELRAMEDDRWKQVYLLDAESALIIRDGNRSNQNLMIYYRLTSSNVDLDTLQSVANSLVPYEDVYE